MQRLKEVLPRTEAASSLREHAAAARTQIERLLADREPVALFLDIDGTLLDVALTPSTVHVPPVLPALLDALAARLSGALAIITGRQLEEADHLLRPSKFAGAGVHGAQMRLSAGGPIEHLTPSFDAALVGDIQRVVEALPGVVFEDKGSGIALHYRLAPELEEPLRAMLDELVAKHRDQFKVCGGRKVIEILPIGFSKGRALRKLVSLPQFANRTPVMIGDDVSDLDAFRAAEDLGGVGLKVAGENFRAEESSFQGPADVLNWLQRVSGSDR